ncbi:MULTISPECIES: VTT domain-containing protein [unclassified Methanoculleus]|jgi:membrane-associated protein|uniref:VTT domain-containing protein n=1 Tax=Methanoculleus palmolei TaxID=72612 RepID=A0ABD8AAF2_9EURY|nr:VTT domain-containing protein [Methanoculleus sp. UBA377]MDD2472480.1 VTT domain-containing protein [Methanoculleus sp.]WOX56511.1 VTT domain-containing protein [Methanoculleus palmolei]
MILSSLPGLVELVLHTDQYLFPLIDNYGTWIYLIIFLIIFCETGFVVTPFLPGDSLLFILGVISATGVLNPLLLIAVLILAAVLGDATNYHIGATLGRSLLGARWCPIRETHVAATESFYHRYGGLTIVIARFVPYIRTLAPFIAGVVRMGYPKFFGYNALGGFLWVTGIVAAGYFLGTVPVVQEYRGLISLAVLVITVVSVVIIIIGVIRLLRCRRAGNP